MRSGRTGACPQWRRLRRWALAGGLGLGLISGCAPQQTSGERDLNYVLGEQRESAGDYAGAAQAFEAVLTDNPQAAAAHFELGWLCDQKMGAPAVAIYHYERYLSLKPAAENAALVKERIEICRQKIAMAVLPLPSMPAEQRQLQDLVEQHEELENKIQRLQSKLMGWSDFYRQWMAQTNAMAAEVAVASSARPVPAATSEPVHSAADAVKKQRVWPKVSAGNSEREHTVMAGETAFGIARRCGVSLEALLGANPGMEPHRLTVGEVINVPARAADWPEGVARGQVEWASRSGWESRAKRSHKWLLADARH